MSADGRSPAGRLYWGACEQCGSEMRVRSGPNGMFLGCSSYPRCDHTRRLDAEAKMILDGRLNR